MRVGNSLLRMKKGGFSAQNPAGWLSISTLSILALFTAAVPMALAGSIGPSSFATKVDSFVTNGGASEAAVGDLDGDGKVDFILSDGAISAYRNTSAAGSIDSTSFASRVEISTIPDGYPKLADLDGDGKLDLVVPRYGSFGVSVFRNISSLGSIAFDSPITLSAGNTPFPAAVGDLDTDGKLDLVVPNSGDDTISVFRNVSSPGTISFESGVTFATGTNPRGVAVADIDTNGKNDIVVANFDDGTLSIFRNTTLTIGIITVSSFATPEIITTSSFPANVLAIDLDGNSVKDLVVNGGGITGMAVHRNASVPSTISFDSPIIKTHSSSPGSLASADLNADGKEDIVINLGDGKVGVYENTSSVGSLSFGTLVEFAASHGGGVAADVDADSKNDLIVPYSQSAQFAVLKNIISLNSSPTLTSISPLSGGTRNMPYTISYSALSAAADESDPDGNTISFRVDAISSGNLFKGGAAVVPGTTILQSGEELVWLPPAGLDGILNAFTVVATDGVSASSTPIQVKITVSPASFPISENFNGKDFSQLTSSGWLLSGNATATSDKLRLTEAIDDQNGAAIYNQAFNSGLGINVQFDYFMGAGTGADGFSFFLLDGSVSTPTPGASGGSLGYAYSADSLSAGVSKGFMGIGFDDWGNFLNNTYLVEGLGSALFSDYISIRGPSTVLNSTELNGEYRYVIGSAAQYTVRGSRKVNLTISGDRKITMQVSADNGATWTSIYDDFDFGSSAPYSGVTTPSTFKLGFAASTGGENNEHSIDNLQVSVPLDLDVGYSTGPSSPVSANSLISYSFRVLNNGPNSDSGVVFSHSVPSVLVGVTWNYSLSSGGTGSGSGNTISQTLPLLSGAFATITISGTVSSTAAGQTLTLSASATPSSSAGDPDLTNNQETQFITVRSGNAAPTLNTVNVISGAKEDQSFTITYSLLQAAADENDSDGDTVRFVVQSVFSGTLMKDGSPVVPGSTLLEAGQQLVWTPPANVHGNQNAFTIKASDGSLLSASPITVHVDVDEVNDAPTFVAGGTSTAAEDAPPQTQPWATLIGSGPGDPSQTLTFDIVSNNNPSLFSSGPTVDPDGDVVFTPAPNAHGTARIEVNLKDDGGTDDGGSDTSATVQLEITITPENDVPTLTSVLPLTGGTEDTTFTISHSQLIAAADEADIDGGSITFVVDHVESGSLTKGGSPVGPGTTLLAGESFIWSPEPNDNGEVTAFFIKASDGITTSFTPIPVKIHLAPVNDITFSHPVPPIYPNGLYQSALIGLFEESGVHQWKMRLRDSGTHTVTLNVTASTVNPAETGAIRVTLVDETGPKTIEIPHPASNGDDTQPLSVSLLGNKTYDISVQRVDPASGPVAHHYKLGSPNRLLELAWEDPLRYLEPEPQNWAVHADAGENVVIELFTDDVHAHAPQTTSVIAYLSSPTGEIISFPGLYTTPAMLSVPSFTGGSLIVNILNADGHFRLRKLSGIDKGFYLVPGAPLRAFKAHLFGGQEVPPNLSIGEGFGRFYLAGNVLNYEIEYFDLSGPPTDAHIHGPAGPGHTASPVHPLPLPATPAISGKLSGSVTYDTAQIKDLFKGEHYVNLHSATYPSGEIRGQITFEPNAAPVLSPFANVSMNLGDSDPVIPFTVFDPESLVDTLTFSVTSSNQRLLPDSEIQVTGTGQSKNLVISPVPGRLGEAEIVVLVTDPAGQETERRFKLDVKAPWQFYSAQLNASQTVPPATSFGAGMAKFALEGNLLKYSIVFGGLSGPLTSAQIHGPATSGTVGAPLFDISPSLGAVPSGIGVGSILLNSSQINDLNQGLLYINLSTVAFAGGEIRGQIVKVDPAPTNDEMPFISPIEDQRIFKGLTRNIPITIGDLETPLDKLTLSAHPDNTALFPTGSITFPPAAGPGNLRLMSLTPAANQLGNSTIRVDVEDGFGLVSSTYVNIRVINPVAFLAANLLPASNSGVVGIGAGTFVIDGSTLRYEIDFFAESPLIKAEVRGPALSAGGAPVVIDLPLNPGVHELGRLAGEILLTSGQVSQMNSGVQTLVLMTEEHPEGALDGTIVPLANPPFNDAPPSVFAVAHQRAFSGSLREFPVWVGDLETPANLIIVTAESSNPSIVSQGNLEVTGTGANRTVKVTPTAGQQGSANLIIKVEDANGSVVHRIVHLRVAPAVDFFESTLAPIGGIATVGSGLGKFVIDGTSLRFDIQYRDLTGKVTGAQIRGAAANLADAPVVLNLPVSEEFSLTGTIFGTVDAGSTLASQLAGGAHSLVLVTESNPGGEIAGLISKLSIPPVADDPPIISDFPGVQRTFQNVPREIRFQVGDLETPANQLVLSKQIFGPSGSRPVLDSGLVLETIGSSGIDRKLTITPKPNELGSTFIGIHVADATGLMASRFFELKVIPALDFFEADLAAINGGSAAGFSALHTTVEALGGKAKFVLDGAILKYEISVSGLSSPIIGARLTGPPLVSGGEPVVVNLPLSGHGQFFFGQVSFATELRDQLLQGQQTLVLRTADFPNGELGGNVAKLNAPPAVDDRPTISFIPRQRIIAGQTISIPFQVGDLETAAAQLEIHKHSHNTTLLPVSNIGVSGTGREKMLTIATAAGQEGAALVTIEVEDLSGNRSATVFEVEITPPLQFFTAHFSGSQHVPPSVSLGTGSGKFVLDGTTLRYDIVFQGLRSRFNGASIFGPADPGAEGPLLMVLPEDPMRVGNRLVGEAHLNDVQIGHLLSGKVYFEIASESLPGGELRGQVIPSATPIADEPPFISPLPSYTTVSDGIQPNRLFVVGDLHSRPDELQFQIRSSNPAIISNGDLILTGQGNHRFLVVEPLPGQSGLVSIAVDVKDRAGNISTTGFEVSVLQDGAVTIPDAALKSAVYSALSKATTDSLLVSELLMLQELTADATGISNLAGLEMARNLRVLRLAENQIQSISSLSPLTDLQILDLTANPVTGGSALASLSRLRSLRLSGTQIGNFSFIQNSGNLEELWLSGAGISDLNPLSGLTKLRILELNDNGISDLTPLQNLTQLRELFVAGNQIMDYSVVDGFNQLFRLNISENQIVNLTPLQGLTQLRDLDVSFNPITSLAGVEGLIHLQNLRISGLNLDVLPDLSTLSELVSLDLHNNNLAQVPSFSSLAHLNTLDLRNNRIDVTPETPAGAVITSLRARNVVVTDLPQKNFAPVAAADNIDATEDTPRIINASELLVNDVAGPAFESGQSLQISQVPTTTPGGGTLALASGLITYTPAPNFSGSDTFSYTITDNGLSAETPDPKTAVGTVTINVGQVNDAPVLAPIADSSINEGSLLAFTAAGTDVDGTSGSLTYSLGPGAPAGASINPTTGQFNWVPNEAQGPGTFDITVTVSDAGSPALTASDTFRVTVFEVNSEPSISFIGSRTIAEGQNLSFTISGNDSDIPSNSVSFRLGAGAPVGATLSPNGAFNWTPSEAQGPGTFNITVEASDSGSPSLTVVQSFSVTVSENNQSPVISSIAPQTIAEGQTLSLSVSASDPDVPAATLSYSLAPGAPAGATINPATGAFSWSPGESDGPGTISITVVVSDNGGPGSTASQAFSVNVQEVNLAPALGAISGQNIKAGETVTVTASATDTDLPANILTYSLGPGAPAGASINPATGQFTWTPTPFQAPSTNQIVVQVSDGGAANSTASTSFTVVVTPSNTAPTLSSVADQIVPEGSPFTLQLNGRDSDVPSNTLTYSIDGAAPAGLAINPSSGLISWTPTEEQGPSTNSVVFRVQDNGIPQLEAKVTVRFLVSEINQAPVLAALPDQTIKAGETVTLQAAATDADAPRNGLSYSLSAGSPTGASVDPATGLFRWTTVQSQGGTTNTITIQVSDNAVPPATDSKSFRVIVTPSNKAPVFAAVPDQSISEGAPFTLQLNATDSDVPPNKLTFAAIGTLPSGLALAADSGVLSWTPTEVQGPSTNRISLRVSDDGVPSLSATQSVTIVVTERNDLPVFDAAGEQSVDEGSALVFSVRAVDPDNPPNAVTYGLGIGAPLGMTINPATGEIRWTPSETAGPGTNRVSVTATDNGTPASRTNTVITVIVREINQPPTLAAIPGQTLGLGDTLTLKMSATDPDRPANVFTYSLGAGAPAGATIDPISGELKWTPSASQVPSTNRITVQVSDGSTPPLTDSKAFTTVVRAAPNQPPTISPITAQTTKENTPTAAILFFINDSDTPIENLSLTAVSSNPTLVPVSNIAFGGVGTNRSVTITPALNQTGQANITLTVKETTGASATSAFSLTVTAVGPTITRQPADQNVLSGAPATFSVTASGSQPLRYQWFFNGSIIQGATNSVLSFAKAEETNAGNYTVDVSNAVGTVSSGEAKLAVDVPLRITQQPVDQTVLPNAELNLKAAATGRPPLNFQWRKDGASIGGANSLEFRLEGAQPTDSGNYDLVVSNAGGSITSSVARVVINAPVAIVQPPQSQSAVLGTNVSFSVQASGTPPIFFQWLHNGVNLDGRTNATLELAGITATEAGDYTVQIRNGASTLISPPAKLTITAPPIISRQPQAQTNTVGSTATFLVVAGGTEPLSYQWRFNEQVIDGATGPSLRIDDVQIEKGGSYSVVVSSPAGSVTSDAVPLVVSVPATIGQQPADQTAAVDATASFSVTAIGTGPITYQWRFNGADIQDATQPTLTLPKVQTVNQGLYRVVIKNPAGTILSTEARLTVNAPVSIVEQPKSLTVTNGQLVTFSVAALGTGPLSYQWRYNGANINGANSPEFSISSVQVANAGVYSVAVSNLVGQVVSGNAELKVIIPPSIRTQPVSQTVQPGAQVTFAVDASGDEPLTYQWQLNGINISGANSRSYTVSSAQPENAGSYTVVVENPGGTATSESATLGLILPTITLGTGAGGGPPIESEEGTFDGGSNEGGLNAFGRKSTPGRASQERWFSWKAPANGIATFSTSGSTFDTMMTVYTGTQGNLTAIASDDDRGGFFSSRVSFNAVLGTTYHINIQGFGGAVGKITVGFKLERTDRTLPVITAQPQSAILRLGESRIIGVTASGNQLSYQWYFNGQPIDRATESGYFVFDMREALAGSYTVKVTSGTGPNAITVESLPAVIQMSSESSQASGLAVDKFKSAPRLDGGAQLASLSRDPIKDSAGSVARGYSGSQVFSTFGATREQGEPNHADVLGGASQWFTYVAPQTGVLKVTTDGSDFDTVLGVYTGPGTDFETLKLEVADNNSGTDGKDSMVTLAVTRGTTYYVAVDGVNGASGTVKLGYELAMGPRITQHPASQAVSQGNNIILSVTATNDLTATGNSPAVVNYQWRKDGFLLAGQTNRTLQIQNFQLANVGDYAVIVSNFAGASTSSIARLSISAPLTETVAPQSLIVDLGARAVLNATFGGSDPITYQWRLNGANVPGATNSTLEIPSVQLANVGQYVLVATNPAGTKQSTAATVALRAAPTITGLTPVSPAQAALGGSAAFEVAATGSGVLSYQWRFNGIDIPGATQARLVISSVRAGDAGSYTVVVSNESGSRVSDAIQLSIVVPLQITAVPQSQEATLGSSAVFSVSAIGSGNLAYQWRFNGNNINGANSPIYSIPSVQGTSAGSYSVVVSDGAQSLTNSASLAVLAAPVISAQPVSQTVSAGATVTFTVVASGESLKYQWFFNGQQIPGAITRQLELQEVQAGHTGSYSVEVSNRAGRVLSDLALLNVFQYISDLRIENGTLRFRVTVPAGETWIVETATDVGGQGWTVLGEPLGSGVYDVEDREASLFEYRFYRLRRP